MASTYTLPVHKNLSFSKCYEAWEVIACVLFKPDALPAAKYPTWIVLPLISLNFS